MDPIVHKPWSRGTFGFDSYAINHISLEIIERELKYITLILAVHRWHTYKPVRRDYVFSGACETARVTRDSVGVPLQNYGVIFELSVMPESWNRALSYGEP